MESYNSEEEARRAEIERKIKGKGDVKDNSQQMSQLGADQKKKGKKPLKFV